MEDLAIIGVGMHPWGKWGRNFAEYGTFAAREALAEAGVDWKDVGYISGAITVRNGYPGYVAGSTFARALGFNGAQVSSSYSACASGVTALQIARGQILSGATDVALVVALLAARAGVLLDLEGRLHELLEAGDDVVVGIRGGFRRRDSDAPRDRPLPPRLAVVL